jgi:hypothetical protein
MSAPVAGTGLRERGLGGVPPGCGGWRNRSARGFGRVRGARADRAGVSRDAAARAAGGRAGAAGVRADARGRFEGAFAPCGGFGCGDGFAASGGFGSGDGFAASGGFGSGDGFAASGGFGSGDGFTASGGVGSGGAPFPVPAPLPPRFSLRRCGRVRGSAPRTSDGGFSLIRSHDRALLDSTLWPTARGRLERESRAGLCPVQHR